MPGSDQQVWKTEEDRESSFYIGSLPSRKRPEKYLAQIQYFVAQLFVE